MMFHDEVPITRISTLEMSHPTSGLADCIPDLVYTPICEPVYNPICEPIYATNPELIDEMYDVDDIITEQAERAVLHCPIIISDRPPYFGG